MQAGALVVVDNSILAPVFQQPLALGADISMTSGTKFIGGPSDITAGILSAKDHELAKQVYFFQVRVPTLVPLSVTFCAECSLAQLLVGRLDRLL